MGILQAENSVAYTANNTIKIYIIKQEAYENKQKFEQDYASLLGDATDPSKFISTNNAAISASRSLKLIPLVTFDLPAQENLYEEIDIYKDAPDRPIFQYNENGNDIIYKPDSLYFLTSLFQLRNCPLIDLDKLAYVFQIEGQAQGGLANVISFNTSFNVNGQSSAELVLNNKDFLYNFKYFNNRDKYPFHLKSYFDTNDIIIIRVQKKNIQQTSLLNSFKGRQVEYWKDPYIDSETDPFTTIFTGYINDINDSFSFSNGQQQVSLVCTGPSKKLTWKRFVSNKAAASKDAESAILPFSAYINPQTIDEKHKTSIDNAKVVKNAVVRTYSGVLNIPEVKNAYIQFTDAFDKSNNIKTDAEIKDLEAKIKGTNNTKQIDEYNKQLTQRKSDLLNKSKEQQNIYIDAIDKYMNDYAIEDKESHHIGIKKHLFTNIKPDIFVINGTDQPAYKWAFNNYSSLFKSDFSTVYQFLKSIADNLQFNFYDDPYGTIHFSVPDMTLMHLYNPKDPNNLNQLISFSETQNTENIANVQYCEAAWIYDLPLDMFNTVAKDYRSIQKYGEKMMQPFSMTGLTSLAAIRYAARMRMAKYNRKALSSIKVNMQGEPCLQMDKYAYIKSLRKLFYVESYSHSYTAGDNITTSLNGTYTRDILCIANFDYPKGKIDNKFTNTTSLLGNIGSSALTKDKQKILDNTLSNIESTVTVNRRLENCTNQQEVIKLLSSLQFPSTEILADKIYQIYVENWSYPAKDEDLKYDIAAMYNKNSLSQCLLDGFFWALPFDADPYQVAIQIQEEERQKVATLQKTISTKSNKKKINLKNTEDLNKTIHRGAVKQLKQAIDEYEIIKKGGTIIKASNPESSIPYTELDNGVRIYDYSKIRKAQTIGVKFDVSKLDIRKGRMLDIGVESLLKGDKE